MSKESPRREDKQKPRLGGVNTMEKKLYAKNTKIKDYRRMGFGKAEADDIPTSWEKKKKAKKVGLIEKKDKEKNKTPMSLFTKILLASIAFFAVSVLAAFMVFALQANEVNYGAVDLSVRGPNTVSAGEELMFDINITNNNPVNIILTDVIVKYPSGTLDADEGYSMEKDIVSIEEVRSGLSSSARFKAILFGAENDVKEIAIVFQYRVQGSDTIFFKERVYKVELEAAPVVINPQHENNFQNGDEVTIEVDLLSNAVKPLHNLLLSVDYPFGFEFASSTPQGIDAQTYRIDSLEPGEKTTITIKGSIRGQNQEERTIRYSLGSESGNNEGVMGTVLALNQSVLNIARPPITLSVTTNNQDDEVVVARPGQELDVRLGYINSLQTKLLDTEIEVEFSGTGYNRRSIDAGSGYFRSTTNTISWLESNDSTLKEIEPGRGGSLGFSLDALETASLAGVVQNPEFFVTVNARATNFELGGEEKKVEGGVVQKIKIETDPSIQAYLLYTEGPFENSGSMQPRVDEVTTYTLVLEAYNTTNTVSDATIEFTLPRYMSLRELLEPSRAEVDFDTRSRVVTWQIGELAPGLGYTQDPETLYLSLAFEPSLDQVGSAPSLVTDLVLRGHDDFTQTRVVDDRHRKLTTDLRRDPGFEGKSRVRE